MIMIQKMWHHSNTEKWQNGDARNVAWGCTTKYDFYDFWMEIWNCSNSAVLLSFLFYYGNRHYMRTFLLKKEIFKH
jgi:hypothetical protein